MKRFFTFFGFALFSLFSSNVFSQVDSNGCVDLMAGQFDKAGTVCITNDFTNLTVTYQLDGNWQFGEVHLWAGTNTSDMPQNRNGSPKIGQFPYVDSNLDGQTSKTFVIPFASIGASCTNSNVYAAAHAVVYEVIDGVVLRGETAWAAGERFRERGSWATYFHYELNCNDPGTGGGDLRCETAFAFGEHTLNSLPEVLANRWGWYATITGTATYDIWAGAGQNDTLKGAKVGQVTYDYVGTSLSVNVQMFFPYQMKELHINASYGLPTTVAPGQYTYVLELGGLVPDYMNDLMGSYSAPAELNMITHANVCAEVYQWPSHMQDN